MGNSPDQFYDGHVLQHDHLLGCLLLCHVLSRFPRRSALEKLWERLEYALLCSGRCQSLRVLVSCVQPHASTEKSERDAVRSLSLFDRRIFLVSVPMGHRRTPIVRFSSSSFSSRRVQEVHEVTGFEELGDIKWDLAFCLLIVFVIVYFALWKGIKSSGKVREQTVP